MGLKELVVVTTSGVNLSEKLRAYASKANVLLTHYWAEYMIMPGNEMKLRFKKVLYNVK